MATEKVKTEVRIECTEAQLRRLLKQIEVKSMDEYANMHSQRAYKRGADKLVDLAIKQFGKVCVVK